MEIKLMIIVIGFPSEFRGDDLLGDLEIFFPAVQPTVFAIRGRSLQPGTKNGSQKFLGRRALPGEVGCSMSHKSAYQRFLQSDCTHLLVFEDDARLLGWAGMELEMKARKDASVWVLGWSGSTFARRDRGSWDSTSYPATGTFSYLVCRLAGELLLEEHNAQPEGLFVPADWPVPNGLTFRYPNEPLAIHSGQESSINRENATPTTFSAKRGLLRALQLISLPRRLRLLIIFRYLSEKFSSFSMPWVRVVTEQR